jgi:endogenous inhibitor of DNA gyrase (YacG/DUF329 family)
MSSSPKSSSEKPSLVPRIVRCPQCKQEALYAESNPHRPFCSARCRGVDLINWSDENYKVPVRSTDQDIEKITAGDENDDDRD